MSEWTWIEWTILFMGWAVYGAVGVWMLASILPLTFLTLVNGHAEARHWVLWVRWAYLWPGVLCLMALESVNIKIDRPARFWGLG